MTLAIHDLQSQPTYAGGHSLLRLRIWSQKVATLPSRIWRYTFNHAFSLFAMRTWQGRFDD